jgi:cytochrome oxidase Cu insertion factor (SCO1/SenC/PrrC family)
MVGIKSLTTAFLVIAASSLTFAISLQESAPVATLRSTPVAVGEMAPDFRLEDHQGNKITLSEARGKSPVVLVFYRGYW